MKIRFTSCKENTIYLLPTIQIWKFHWNNADTGVDLISYGCVFKWFNIAAGVLLEKLTQGTDEISINKNI